MSVGIKGNLSTKAVKTVNCYLNRNLMDIAQSRTVL